jgi:hypothetical protein
MSASPFDDRHNLRLGGLGAMPVADNDATEQTIDLGDQEAVVDDSKPQLEIEHPDGSITISFASSLRPKKKKGKADFYENLAMDLHEDVLNGIGSDLARAIQQDDESRTQWLEDRAKGIDLLGLKLNTPKGEMSASGAMEGISTVNHPLLLEAVLRFQANARGELLPADGPVKVKVDNLTSGAMAVPKNPATAGMDATMGHNGGPAMTQDDQEEELADVLERGFNTYLTVTAKEYYPDTDRMLLMVGFGGCAFKKVYNCPIRRRPVSESIDAAKLIVSNAATDMQNASRVTHEIEMKRSTFVRMKMLGVYRDIDLDAFSAPQRNAVEQKVDDLQGVSPQQTNDLNDTDLQLWECYCELDIPGYEHEYKGKKTGLAIPYRVTLDKQTNQILEIRRNYRPDDEDMALPRTYFVKYSFIPSFGFYDIGLLHILGNTTAAATAAWREMLDAGMFASFPGFLFAKQVGRQATTNFRVPPGGGVPVETNGMPISDAIMPLPYKGVDPSQIQLVENITQTGQRIGGTAEMNVGEGRQDAPVGTTIALIEQATKVMDAVHKRLHAAQAEEFGLLKERFLEDPEAFWRFDRKNASGWDKARFLAALENNDLVPKADPNTSSHMMRIMKAVAVKQLQAQSPDLYDGREVDTQILRVIGWEHPEALFVPPQPPGAAPPDPKIAGATIKAQADDAMHQRQVQADAAENDKDRQLKVQQMQSQQALEAGKMQILTRKQALEEQGAQINAGLGQAKLQLDSQKTELQKQGLAQNTQQMQDKLAAESAAAKLDAQVNLHKTAQDNQTKAATNDADNRTALQITQMEIGAASRQTQQEHALQSQLQDRDHQQDMEELDAQHSHEMEEGEKDRKHEQKLTTNDHAAQLKIAKAKTKLTNGKGIGRGPTPGKSKR